jgi:DNA-binding transcriptional LysR family regulator
MSALTKRIKRLEAAVGVPLIERDTGGYAGLTPAGRRFVQFAPSLVHAAGPPRPRRRANPSKRWGLPSRLALVSWRP